jgi:hypothetical protein
MTKLVVSYLLLLVPDALRPVSNWLSNRIFVALKKSEWMQTSVRTSSIP